MSLTIRIAGLPNAGKLTLFNTLTRATVLAVNHPSVAIEPNVGIMSLPGPRLKVFAKMFHLEEVIPATVSFVDIAGIVRGAFEGEGLGNQLLADIRKTDVICQVMGTFSDPDIAHTDDRVNPASDIEIIQTELVLADMQILEEQIPRLEKEVRDKKTEPIVLETVKEVLALLEKGELLPGPVSAALDQGVLKSLQLMTTKPFIFVFNIDQAGMEDEALQQSPCDFIAPTEVIFFDTQFEPKLVELDEKDIREMPEDPGQIEADLDKLAHVGFAAPGLQTYLTVGPKEVRAWTVHHGDTVPQAVGVIHMDFQCGLVKAGIMSYNNLVGLGGMQEAHAAGRARMEGKNYVMTDGDIVEFRLSA